MQVANHKARGREPRGIKGIAQVFAAGVIALGITGSALAQTATTDPVLIVPPPFAAASPVMAAPAPALQPAAAMVAAPVAAPALTQAEKLRRLDIMLMVTGLRCRATGDDFQADYERFTVRHLSELNAAAADLRKQLVKQHGVLGAFKALDQMSTSMANAYGEGHPWLGCHDLKTVAALLVEVESTDTLVEAAGQLLERQRAPHFAMVGH